MTDEGIRERIVDLLRTSGLSQGEYAALIAATPDKLSKSLAGKRKFTATELALAAEHAGTTVDWLLRGVHPASPAIAARTAVAVPPDAVEIDAVVGRFTDAAHQIELLDGPRDLCNLPTLVDSTSYVAQGERLAVDARAMLSQESRGGDPGELIPDLESVFDIDIAVTSLPGDLDGCAWQSATERFIAVERDQPRVRQNFTLAHELGHILAGDAQELISEEDPARHADRYSEKRANAFAAGFLMPADGIRETVGSTGGTLTVISFATMVAKYGVSPLSLSWRLVNLNLLSKEDRPVWGSVSAERCLVRAGVPETAAKTMCEAQPERIPPRLEHRHRELFANGETSARPLAHLLGCDSSWVIENVRES